MIVRINLESLYNDYLLVNSSIPFSIKVITFSLVEYSKELLKILSKKVLKLIRK